MVSSHSPTSLSTAQRRLLEQRLRERAAADLTTPAGGIPRAPRDGPLALSFGQERLWLLHHLEPDVPAYNSAYLYRLRGPLNVAALERALLALVQRHESLRTTIVVHDGVPRQVVQDVATLPLPVTSVPSLDEARTQARPFALRRFDLTRDLPLRSHLFRVSINEHVLLITAHHSAWDASSTQVFWRELETLYAAFAAGQRDPLPPPSAVQYADFAAWQRQRLQGANLDRLLEFWRGQLANAAPLDLPSDRPRPPELTYAGGIVDFGWPADLRDALQAVARTEGATLFMLLLAGWSTLLHRLSAQDTIVTGTALAGRTRREFEPLIGFFVNTLALRTKCHGDPTFRELLGRVRTTTLAAYDHDELPFEKLVADLRVPRDPARHPVFQTALVLHPSATAAPALAGLEVTALPRVVAHARFDLALTLTETADGLQGALEFSTDLFDETTVRRWIGHLETLLRAAVAQPQTRINALPLLRPAERAELLGPWAGAPAPYPRDLCVHDLFTRQAQRTPTATALLEGDNSLTYAELDARADRLAARLGANGVTPGTFVAIELERSINFVVSVLAVLKTGAAYVPVLRDLPAARRRFILEDTRAVALITAGAPAGDVPADTRVIDLGADPAAPAAGHELAPRESAATDAAYVMYTSGSTGRPKGVVLPHRGIVRLVHGMTPPPFAAGQCFLLLASTAFDASTFELWAPLLNGATLAIFPERWPEFDALDRVLRRHGVTHLFLTAGLFNQVVEHRPDLLGGVTHLFTGGEAMSPRHARRVRELWPRLRVTNCYGPTEITTYTISHELAVDETWPTGSVPIGRPVPNSRCYILDPRGEPVPVGVPGELQLGGDGLAHGYLNLPELTHERFVPDPFAGGNSDAGQARRYRTGDRGRWRTDGTIEFLGRFDDQVKIRGFRIEPGEVEAVLAQHPDVRAAAVIAREDEPGATRLVAYVAPRAEGIVAAPALRDHLADRLPDYMVPAAIVFVPELPLTPNGKLDRRALPAPEADTEKPATAPAAPHTAMEQAVAEVWRTVLRRENVGTHDNFFALGGHSLLAMQATARLGAAVGRDVPLRWWFDHPTIAALAEHIDRAHGDAAVTPILPVSRGGELPLSHEEQRLWFLQHVLPDPATYHVVWGERLRGPLDLARLRGALAAVMARHEILRTGYAERDGQPVRVIAASPALPLAVEMPDLTGGAGSDLMLQRHLAADVRQPFQLDRPPLWRATCVQLGTDDHLLAFTAHHLICDEWSLTRWRAELLAAYAPEGAPAPPLAVQYVDYAFWQRNRVATAASMQRARSFWRDHLAGAPSRLKLPQLASRTAIPTGGGRRVFFPLPRATVEGTGTGGPPRGRDAVHGVAHRIRGAARPLDGTTRRRRGHPAQPAPSRRVAAADRFLPEHAADSRARAPRHEFSRVVARGAWNRARRIRPRRAAARRNRRRTSGSTHHDRRSVVQRHVCAARRSVRAARLARDANRTARPRHGNREGGPDPVRRTPARRGTSWRVRVQHRHAHSIDAGMGHLGTATDHRRDRRQS